MRREPGRGREDTREGCLYIGLAGAWDGGRRDGIWEGCWDGGEDTREGCLYIGLAGAWDGGRRDGVGDGLCAGPCTFFRQAG